MEVPSDKNISIDKKNAETRDLISGFYAIPGVTDLETVNPRLAKEWDIKRNEGRLPSGVTPYCGDRVWWRCKHGHEWRATVSSRSNGARCPVCYGRKRSTRKLL